MQSLQWLWNLLRIVVLIAAAAALPFAPDGHWVQVALVVICLLAFLAIVSTLITFAIEENEPGSLEALERRYQQGLSPARTHRGRQWPWYALQVGIAVTVWSLFANYDPLGGVARGASSTITASGAAVVAAFAVSAAVRLAQAVRRRSLLTRAPLEDETRPD